MLEAGGLTVHVHVKPEVAHPPDEPGGIQSQALKRVRVARGHAGLLDEEDDRINPRVLKRHEIGVRILVAAPAGMRHARREPRGTPLHADLQERRAPQAHQILKMVQRLRRLPVVLRAHRNAACADLHLVPFLNRPRRYPHAWLG